ncbi:MAG TPA: MOSC domain-containing protein [Ktedonobacterales bacterium]|jgi:hypothetical protein
MDSSDARLAATFTTFVASFVGSAVDSLPHPEASGAEWRAVLRLWLAQRDCGLVSLADPGHFSWAGHWIGIVEPPEPGASTVAVLLFGTPSAVIASPDAPGLVGKAVEELRFREGVVLVPFQPFRQPTLQTDLQPARHSGVVAGIYLAGIKTEPMRAVQTARAIQGQGLQGDRYAAKAGTFTPRSDRLRGYDLTLIEGEVLDAVTLADGSRIASEESRRNLVTRGIDLNALVGREFRIGALRVFGQRLCEPCVHLQRLTRPGIVSALVHRGGLRADVLSDGEIHVGDPIEA